jgi:hypothetical protein
LFIYAWDSFFIDIAVSGGGGAFFERCRVLHNADTSRPGPFTTSAIISTFSADFCAMCAYGKAQR